MVVRLTTNRLRLLAIFQKLADLPRYLLSRVLPHLHKEIENVIEHSIGTEGGATYCFKLNPDSDKENVFRSLELLQTDLKETNYRIISLNNCSNTNP